MKKIIFLLTITAVVTLIACSNKKANDDGSVNNTEAENNAASTMTCSINGQPFAATEFFDQLSNKFSFTLVGYNKGKTLSVGLYFPRDKTKAGAVFNYKFKMGEETDNSVSYTKHKAGTDGQGSRDELGFGESTITITKATANRIEGTFVAKGKNDNITNGKFSFATKLKW
jgi:hypothetical protein